MWKITINDECFTIDACSTLPENKYPIAEGGIWECERSTKCSIKCPNGNKVTGQISCHKKTSTACQPRHENKKFNEDNWIVPPSALSHFHLPVKRVRLKRDGNYSQRKIKFGGRQNISFLHIQFG